MDIDEEKNLRPLQKRLSGKKGTLRDEEILIALSSEFFHRHQKRLHIFELTSFLLLVTIYYSLLWTQFDVKNGYALNESIQNIFPKDENGLPKESFDTVDEIYEWINSSVIKTIWNEPICGDYLCNLPTEVPNGIFLERGCAADCGDPSSFYIKVNLYNQSSYNNQNPSETWNVSMQFTNLTEQDAQFKHGEFIQPSELRSEPGFQDMDSYEDNSSFAAFFDLNQGPNVDLKLRLPIDELFLYGNLVYPDSADKFKVYTDFEFYFVLDIKPKNTIQYSINRNYTLTTNGVMSNCQAISEIPIKSPFKWSINFTTFSNYSCKLINASYIEISLPNPIRNYVNFISNSTSVLNMASSEKDSNKLLIGMLTTLSRTTADCVNTNSSQHNTDTSISQSCIPEFGQNPYYNNGSSFFRKEYYNDNMYITDFPKAFNDSVLNTIDAPLSYFILFDSRYSKQRAISVLNFMKDGAFIDDESNVLTLRLMANNSAFNQVLLLKMSVTFSETGSIDIEKSINFLQMKTSKSSQILNIFFWIILSLFTLTEIIEFCYSIFKKQVLNFITWNIIDLITNSLLLVNAIMWLILTEKTKEFRPQVNYDVYEMPAFQSDDILIPYKTNNVTTIFEYSKMFQQYTDFESIMKLKHIYIAFACLNCIFLVYRVIKLFDFDSNFGIISRTIGEIRSSITSLILLWFIISVGYAVSGIIAFGEQIEHFKDINRAFNTLGETIMGDITVNVLFNEIYTTYFQKLIGHFYFWSYVLLSYIILINFVIAVVSIAFEKFKDMSDAIKMTKNKSNKMEILFVLKSWKRIKYHFLLFRILKPYYKQNDSSQNNCQESQLKSESNDDEYHNENDLPRQSDYLSSYDPSSEIKVISVHGIPVDSIQLTSIMKTRLREELKITETENDEGPLVTNLVFYILHCYGVDQIEKNRKPKDINSVISFENDSFISFLDSKLSTLASSSELSSLRSEVLSLRSEHSSILSLVEIMAQELQSKSTSTKPITKSTASVN